MIMGIAVVVESSTTIIIVAANQKKVWLPLAKFKKLDC